ncbi:unnamed protein product [Calypogeia fissa]
MKSVGGKTNMIVHGMKVTAKTRTFVDIGSVIHIFCENFSVQQGKPKKLYPTTLHCILENHHTKKYSKYELHPLDFSTMHSLEPYTLETNIVTLGFFTISHYFALETVRLIQSEILEGIGCVVHSWQKQGGSLSQTWWIYSQLKNVKQIHHLLNEPLLSMIAFDKDLNKGTVVDWDTRKSGKLGPREVPSVPIIKDEDALLAEIAASPPRTSKPLPIPRNISKRKLIEVEETPAS